MAINQPIPLKLRSLSINDIPQLAALVANPLLLRLVEGIVARRQRVTEIPHIARRMESLPWPDARLPLAGLEDEEQRVETGYYLCEWDAEKGFWGRLVGVKEVVQLLGVGLSVCQSLSLN